MRREKTDVIAFFETVSRYPQTFAGNPSDAFNLLRMPSVEELEEIEKKLKMAIGRGIPLSASEYNDPHLVD